MDPISLDILYWYDLPNYEVVEEVFWIWGHSPITYAMYTILETPSSLLLHSLQ